MDFHHKEILKRYARMATGRPVCADSSEHSDHVRLRHAVRPLLLYGRTRRQGAQETADDHRNVEQISETLGANLGVLIVAGGEPFTRKDLPEIAKAFYKNNKLDAIVLMSNGQIQQRIIPDVTRILEECPNLNVTVALGIDGLKEDHESIRQKPGSWDIAIDTARKLQADQEGIPAARYSDLHLLHEQQSGPHLRVVRLPEVRLEAGQGEYQFHSSAVGAPEGTHHRQIPLRQARHT